MPRKFSESAPASDLLFRLRGDLTPILSSFGNNDAFEQFLHDACTTITSNLAEYVPLAGSIERRADLLTDLAAAVWELDRAFSALDEGAKEQITMARLAELRNSGVDADRALMRAESMLSKIADMMAFARDAARAANRASGKLPSHFGPLDMLLRDLAESYAAAFQIKPSWSTGTFHQVANVVLAAAGAREQVAKTRLRRIIENAQFGPKIQKPGRGRRSAAK